VHADNYNRSAVWELVVGEAASMLGRIRYEVGAADWLLERPDGNRIWLEAAFALKSPATRVAKAEDHPAFRILRSKANRAKASAVTDPVIVCVGTDRVLEFGGSLGMASRDRDWVVASFFKRRSARLSAVIIVPILLRSEVFVGFARDAEPTLLRNPRARSPLPESSENKLQRLDFKRRRFSVETAPLGVRISLRAAIDQLEGSLGAVPASASPRPASHPRRFTWSYTWRFHHVGIRRSGESYWLFDGNEALGTFPSAEEAAQHAATLFQPLPAHVFGPKGIEPNPDRGVAPDLREWQYDPDG
jgi:hypothetical protein